MDRGRVGATRPPNLEGVPPNWAIGDEGAIVLGVRGGVLEALEGNRRCREYMA